MCQYVTLRNVFTDNLWNVHIEQCSLVCYNLLVHNNMCYGGGYGILMLEPTGQQEVASFPTCKQEKKRGVYMAYKKTDRLIAYNNQYNKDKYDRFSLMLPKDKKAIIKNEAEKNGESINAFINRAIDLLLDSSSKKL